MSNWRNWLQKALYVFISCVVIFLLGVITLWIFKDQLLAWGISKTDAKLYSRYRIHLTVNEAKMQGLTGFKLHQIALIPENKDTLFTCHNFDVELLFWPLLSGHVRPDEILVQSPHVSFVKNDSGDNFSILFKTALPKERIKRSKKNYTRFADRLLDIAFGSVPSKMTCNDFQFTVLLDSHRFAMQMPLVTIKEHQLETKILLQEENTESLFFAKALIDKKLRKLDFSLVKAEAGDVVLPLLFHKLGLKAGFEEINVSFVQSDHSRNEMHINGFAEIKGAFVDHPKLAPSEVRVQKSKLSFAATLGENYFQLDSNTTVDLNTWQANIYGFYQNDTSHKVQLKIHAAPFKAQDFFDALPNGLFTHLNGIKVKGKLEYQFLCALDLDHPDSIRLKSVMYRDGFRIINYGVNRLDKMNGPFALPVYDGERYLRSIDVSPANPYFVPYEQLPPKLKFAVLTAEDGSFMSHSGVNIAALAKSISTNIKHKKFKRGGSTISMQLVKNVFLTKNKTVSRKLEELLIVWLIESQRITSKQRMLEVYFNVIEWGPNVYGLGEASNFYFNKPPQQLALNESIFLASIVPSPKRFRRQFDEYGHLQKSQAGYFRLISNIMLRRRQIMPTDKDSLVADVILMGPAKNLLSIKDTSTVIAPAEEEAWGEEIVIP